MVLHSRALSGPEAGSRGSIFKGHRASTDGTETTEGIVWAEEHVPARTDSLAHRSDLCVLIPGSAPGRAAHAQRLQAVSSALPDREAMPRQVQPPEASQPPEPKVTNVTQPQRRKSAKPHRCPSANRPPSQTSDRAAQSPVFCQPHNRLRTRSDNRGQIAPCGRISLVAS